MWNRSGSSFSFFEKGDATPLLPKGVYTLEYGAFGSMYLSRKMESYEFPYKLYGQDGFPERVIKTFEAKPSNLGVMLSGLQGTGKSVQAEQICNLCGLPVILVTKDFDQGKDLVHFLSMLDQPICVFIDEFEKIFKESHALLSIMDGSLNGAKKLFVLTANDLRIHSALLDRPGRIYYLKRFDNLKVDVIREVVDDMLVHKNHRVKIVDYIGSLEIITIDIVKTVVTEVNLFNEPPQTFQHLLNITVTNNQRWDIHTPDGTVIAKCVLTSSPDPFSLNSDLQYRVFTGGYTYLGEVKKTNKKNNSITTDTGTYIVTKTVSIGLF